jgi:hypothetical protein
MPKHQPRGKRKTNGEKIGGKIERKRKRRRVDLRQLSVIGNKNQLSKSGN